MPSGFLGEALLKEFTENKALLVGVAADGDAYNSTGSQG
jgi:hypothetical protein